MLRWSDPPPLARPDRELTSGARGALWSARRGATLVVPSLVEGELLRRFVRSIIHVYLRFMRRERLRHV